MLIGGDLGPWAVRLLAVMTAGSAGCGANRDPGTGGGAGAANGDGAGTAGAMNAVAAGSGGSAAGGTSSGSTSSGGTSSGSTSSGGEGGNAAGGEGQVNPARCENPMAYGGPGSGLVLCEDGMLHRLSRDGACQAGPAPSNGCTVDDDCPPTAAGHGTICVCDEQHQGSCFAAACSDESGCDAGYACVGLATPCVYNTIRFGCQSEADACASSSECSGVACQYGGDPSAMRFACSLCNGTGGRPFLVNAEARTAPTCLRADWLEPLPSPSLLELDPVTRERLAAHWAGQAQLEHASIGAFARFVLELLALGAPAELVIQATRALTDETAHARVCYGLASAYAGRAWGPGNLDVQGALADLSIDGIVERAVLEGCVGETLAAVEASAAAQEATDPVVRAALLRISEDEARHAELSWAFVHWVLARQGGELLPVVRRAFARARSAEPTGAAEPAGASLRQHGVLTDGDRAQLADRVFAEVIAPCAAQLENAAAVTQGSQSATVARWRVHIQS